MPTNRRSFLQLVLGGSWALLTAPGIAEALALIEDPASRRFLAAVAAGDLDTVAEMLDDTPGRLLLRDDLGRSPYAIALLAHQQAMAKLLIERGHEPDLHEAALAGDWTRFEPAAQAAPELLHRSHPVAGTAMIAAALGGVGRSIWRVYRYGGDPNTFATHREPFSALDAALHHPDPAAAELTAAALVANGANPNPPTENGVTPLHRAAARDFPDLVEMLIRRGGEVNARDPEGRTPLEVAEENKHPRAAAHLQGYRQIPRDDFSTNAAYDVDGHPFVPGTFGPDSLLAVQEVVGVAHGPKEGLLEKLEARPDLAKAVATSTEGAVEAAAHMGRLDSVDELLARGAPYSLPTAVMRRDTRRVKELLAQDPKRIHARGPHDFALLWYPVIGGRSLELTETLLAAGAEVERHHHLGTTALHWAARGGHLDLVALLIDHGADPHRIGRMFDPAGETPAAMADKAGHGEVSRYFAQQSAQG